MRSSKKVKNQRKMMDIAVATEGGANAIGGGAAAEAGIGADVDAEVEVQATAEVGHLHGPVIARCRWSPRKVYNKLRLFC